MFNYSSNRVLLFLCFALLISILVQFSILRWRSENYASFFFEHATPKTLAPRGKPISQKKIQSIQQTLDALSQILIERYVTWHQAIVSKVRNGELDASSVRILVFVGNEGRHGLGDRLRGLLFAYFAAVFSDRLLLIHWQDPFPLSTVFVNSLRSNFTYDESLFPCPSGANGQPDKSSVKRATLLDMDLFTDHHKMVLLECEPRPLFEDIFKIVRRFPKLSSSIELKKILPLPKRPQPHQFFPLVFKALFRPSAELRKMMTETIDEQNRFNPTRIWKQGPLRRIDTGKPFISIHARLGFGVGEYTKRFKDQMLGLSMESVAKCMAAKAMRLAREEGLTDPPRFYLATDTVQFRLLLKRALLRMHSRAKVMYGTWSMKHVKRMVGKTPNDLQLFRYTFMDIYILSKGRAILKSRSGFPTLAVWMGAIPSQMDFSMSKDCQGLEL